MREGAPSLTAQRVAAYRLSFERVPAPFGDPSADELLARDVADSAGFSPSERMARYLKARTAFFDRVVVGGIDRGVTQIASIGAGYDGRSLRYAKPGVRWFEVDHRATQIDKRRRLDRLQIDAAHVSFVAIDLTEGHVGSALLERGWERDASSLMLCEGVVVYLDRATFETLLEELRSVASVGTRLAVSGPVRADDEAGREEGGRFREAVAALGEPAANTLTPEQFARVLEAAGWRSLEISERAERVGFVVAAPVWEPAAPAAPPSVS